MSEVSVRVSAVLAKVSLTYLQLERHGCCCLGVSLDPISSSSSSGKPKRSKQVRAEPMSVAACVCECVQRNSGLRAEVL